MTIPANTFAIESAQLSNLYALQNILMGIQKNLSLINFGNGGKLITVNNANLFKLAAIYYEDATQWNTIAEANSLYDTKIIGIMTIIIPAKSLPSGGILTV